jgi:hypothetical protein
MLGVAREAWEAAGYEVRGVALSGIAAENLESGSGIASRTIASMEHGWQRGRDMLSARDVLVIDEAGMVGTRQLERVLSHAAEAGAKVVLVGDPQQLQSIEAGAAFRSIHERHGGAEIGEVRRQREDWQRDATRDLANRRTGNALLAYRSHGMVHEAQTREQARGNLIDRWDRDRQASPDRTRIILTHTNDEVRALNEAARERMRAAGDLGNEVRVTVERGDRGFASGDRVMFLQNERGLVRRVVPERVRNIFDGLRPSAEAVPGTGSSRRPEREAPERKVVEDPEAALRQARTKALVRHARAVDAIFDMQERGGKASPEQVKELQEARKVFEDVRPYGSHDAEAAYKKNPELALEAASGNSARAIRALQFETELRTDPSRRADRFVQRWQKLDHTSQRQYQAGDMSGYKATRSAMGDMAKSLERDPQLESILANRKRDLGIAFESGRRLGQELAFTHGIDLGRGRGIGI